jgi:PAS domain S-box-containing protein
LSPGHSGDDEERLSAFSSIASRMHGFLYRCRNDSNYTMLFMTEGIRSLCGYEASEFIDNRNRTFASILHPDDSAHVDTAVASALESKSAWNVDYRLVCKQGGMTWAHEIGGGVYSDSGKLLYLEGFIVGVDDRKALEMRNKALFDGVGGITGQIVRETRAILDVLRALRMLGFNARIEAARAAGHGLGFDVVAQEITHLADTSADATQRITRLMDQLQELLSGTASG